MSLLYEDELRRLGDAGVPPLLAYLVSTRATPNVTQRVVAARIVADVCESRWIVELIELLTDANADVRFHAAHGLERLTGRDQGAKPDTWKTASLASCESRASEVARLVGRQPRPLPRRPAQGAREDTSDSY